MTIYNTVTPVATTAQTPLERYQPTRTPELNADSKVPFSHAIIGGGLLSTTAVLLVGSAVIFLDGDLIKWLPGMGAGWICSTSLITTGLWFRYRAAVEETIWTVEKFTGINIDSDPTIGKPVAHPVIVNARRNLPSPQAQRQAAETDWLDLMRWFVSTCFRTGKTGEKAMIGKHTPNGKRLTGPLYEELRNTLIGAGYARWRDERDTHLGWAFVDGLTAADIITQIGDRK